MEQVSSLFEPIALFFYAFFLITLLVVRYSHSFLFRGFLILTLIAYFVFTTPLGANLIVDMVEIKEPAPLSCNTEKPSVVLILAGGITDSRKIRDPLARLKEESYRRLIDGIDFARQIKADRVLITGGHGIVKTESELMAFLARSLGYPAKKIIIDKAAMNTYSSSGTVSKILQDMGVDTVWMVTSASHMRRAMATYARKGLTLCAYPVNSKRVPIDFPFALIPQISALKKSTEAYREAMGYVYYALTDRL